MKNLLIKNGLVVTEQSETQLDIFCEDGKIAGIGSNLAPSGDCEILDADGKIVIPGGVDAHTHFCLDTGQARACDDFYSGTIAAACGGTTTIIDHPGFGPRGCALDYQIEKYRSLARDAVIDYGLHGVIQHVDENVLSMMGELAGRGITSFKIYLTYAYKLPDDDVFKVLRKAKELNVLVAVHPENDGVVNLLRREFIAAGKTGPEYHPLSRPAECEAEAINRMILFAKMADNAPLYIVHLSNLQGLDFFNAARAGGQKNLWAETCPQYLLLNSSRYSLPDNEGYKYVMCPPLRGQENCDALWQGLDAQIDTVATDHCPFLLKEKMAADFTQCPSGAGGVEERIGLLFSEGVLKNRISLRRFTDLCCANPARIFGLYPQKGVIAEGSDADVVVLDPEKNVVIGRSLLHGNGDYSVYDGLNVKGWPEATVSGGEIIARNGKFMGEKGRGKFLTRETTWNSIFNH
jgi:dihydropyrimidinase